MTADVLSGTMDRISMSATKETPAKLIAAHSVVIVMRSGILERRVPVALVPFETTLNQDMKAVVAGPGVLPEWIAWGLRAKEREIFERARKAGTTVASLNAKALLDIELPLPPLDEQRRTLEILEEHISAIDAALADLRSVERRATIYYESAIQSMVQNSPGTTIKLGDVLREPMRNGFSAPATLDGSVRVLTLSAVTQGKFNDANSKLTSADRARVMSLWLKPGDIFIQRSNTPDLVGTAALYQGAADWAIFPDLLIRVRPDLARLRPEFLAIALSMQSTRSYFRARARGLSGSMPKIDQGTIASTVIPLPTISEQDAVVSGVASVAGQVTGLRRQVSSGKSRAVVLRAALLQAAFSGQLTGRSSDLDRAEELVS